jgi:hypothetical protein
MFGRKAAALAVLSIFMLPSAQAGLTAESIMQKEMEWAKKGMEKYIDKHEKMPTRASNDSRDDLYPVPDNLHKAASSRDSQESLDEEIDIMMPVSQTSNLRRGNIV